MTPEQIQGEINALKSLLEDTDYNSNKIIDSLVTELKNVSEDEFMSKLFEWIKNTITAFEDVETKRAYYRKRINELEEELIGEENT